MLSIRKATDYIMMPQNEREFDALHQLDKYILRCPIGHTEKLPERAIELFQELNKPITIYSCKYTDSGKIRKILGSNAKTEKGKKKNWMTKVLHLMASNRSGFNLCKFATFGCKQLCLGHSSGRLGIEQWKEKHLFNNAQKAHFLKSIWFKCYPLDFLRHLIAEIIQFGMELLLNPKYEGAIRLNGTSDIPWYLYIDMELLSNDTGLQFYDYTKRPIPPKVRGYHLTYSISEKAHFSSAHRYIKSGFNAAMVVASRDITSSRYIMKKKALQVVETLCQNNVGESWGFSHTIDGDETDLRFLDERRSLVILRAKGEKALRDQTKFVYRW